MTALPGATIGATKVTVACALPAAATTEVGAPGTAEAKLHCDVSLLSTPSQKRFAPTSGAHPGVTADDAAEAGLGPIAFWATTVKV